MVPSRPLFLRPKDRIAWQSNAYNARPRPRARWQEVWDRRDIFATRKRRPAPDLLTCWRWFSLIRRGASTWGTCANYTMGGTVGGGALQGAARGFNVLHPHGLGRLRHAGGERRDGAQGSIPRRGPIRTSRRMKVAAQVDWAVRSIGAARRSATCDPSYYKHQQKMFLDFLKGRGWVERKARQGWNWDPVDPQRVLGPTSR